MPGVTVFISYRREDAAGHAGRIFDRLEERFGAERVFHDVDTVAAGEDFVEAIRKRILQSDVLLVLIGKQWLTATDEAGRWRLANDNDFVRIEVQTALERGIRVIPVLLQGATMPRAQDLPGSLAALARRNAFEIRDTSFDRDLAELIRILAPAWHHKLLRVLHHRPLQGALFALAAALTLMWAYPQFVDTPDQVRVRIHQMGLIYDADSFVKLAERNDAQAVTLFLRAGMPVDSEDERKTTALMHAAGAGYLPLVRELVARGADVSRALPWAARAGQQAVLDVLLASKPTRDALGRALIEAAAEHTDIMKRLLDLGADVNYRDRYDSALGAAASALNRDGIRLLLARGADVNQGNDDGWQPLHRAVDASRQSDESLQQQLDVVRLLLDKGAQLEARAHSMRTWQPTPLLLAIRKPAPEIALLLIERGAEVNVTTGDRQGNGGHTALMAAAEQGLTDVVRVLLAKGAAVNARNAAGHSALLLAATGNSAASEDIARLLLAAGADVNARSQTGSSPLIRAAGRNNGVLPLLLDRGANVNAATKNGWTPLMVAADAGQEDNVRRLLDKGADRKPVNEDNLDAAALAARGNHAKVLRTLGMTPAPMRAAQ